MKIDTNKISIVGFGNVGSHLAFEFDKQGVDVTHVYTRKKEKALKLVAQINARLVDKLNELPPQQLVILCVPDIAIASVLEEIPKNCPVAYTSGSTELKTFSNRDNLGVIYPLQTFTKGVPLNIFEIPFFIEAKNEYFARLLFDLAWKISRKVSYASSEKRGDLHLAAVWVNNFTNHMNFIADQFLKSKDLEFEHLKPLLLETAKKLQTESPREAQTGPARRNDDTTIVKHLSELTGDKKEIYRILSESIQKTYKND